MGDIVAYRKPAKAQQELRMDEYQWHEVRDQVFQVKPELARIIDDWDPGKEHLLYKASFPFGTEFLKDGVIHFPTSSNKVSIPIHAHQLPLNIKKDLSYSSVPLGLIVKNGCEVFLEKNRLINTLAFFEEGVIFGLWEALDPPTSHFPNRIWNASAGARSLYMFPKISDMAAHERLKKQYNVRLPPPKELKDHCRVFSQIVDHTSFKQDWSMDILFFSKKWLERSSEKGWLAFHHYLLEEAWSLSAYARNQLSQNMVWKDFELLLCERGTRANPYLLDILKQAVGIAVNAIPGFAPFCGNEVVGPLELLQSVYKNDYALDYTPTIMRPTYMNAEGNNPIYYPIQLPTLFSTSMERRKKVSLVSELRTLKYLWDEFISLALDGKIKIDNTYLKQVVENINLQLYHCESDAYNEILPTAQLIEEDPRFSYNPSSTVSQPFLPATSPIFKGCIKISQILS